MTREKGQKQEGQYMEEGASRVGKGDLGQNPRNLREILGSLSDQLSEVAPPATRARLTDGLANHGNQR